MGLLARKDFSGGAVVTTLAADMTAGALTFSLSSATNWPSGGVDGKFTVTIDPGLPTEERIWGASLTGTTVTIANLADRGVDNTVVGAHSSGAVVIHSFSGLEADDANRHIYTTDDDHLHYMRADGTRHDTTTRHPAGTVVPTAAPVAIGTALAEGASTQLARASHVHTVGVGAINNSNMFAAGVVDSAAIGADQVGTSEIAPLSVTSAEMADTTIVVGKFNNTIYGSTPSDVGAAAAGGASATVSRNDHVHSTPYGRCIQNTAGSLGGISTVYQSILTNPTNLPANTSWKLTAVIHTENSVTAEKTQQGRIRNITGGTTIDERQAFLAGSGGTKHVNIPLQGCINVGGSPIDIQLQVLSSTADITQLANACTLIAERIPSFT